MNYLVNQVSPDVKTSQLYEVESEYKTDFGYVFGPESHLRRRKLIL